MTNTNQVFCDRTIVNWNEVIQHYDSLKSKLPDAHLLYRVGNWYFAFNEDAKAIARELGLIVATSTLLNRQETAIPQRCFSDWVERLLKAEYTIATYDRPYHRVEQLKTELHS